MSTESTLDEALAAVRVALEELGRSLHATAENASEGVTLSTPGGHVVELERWEWRPGDEPELDDEELDGQVSDAALARVPTPPADVHPLVEQRFTALEVRVVELGKLASRLETRCDAQLGRIIELEAQLAAAAVEGSGHVKRLEGLELDVRQLEGSAHRRHLLEQAGYGEIVGPANEILDRRGAGA